MCFAGSLHRTCSLTRVAPTHTPTPPPLRAVLYIVDATCDTFFGTFPAFYLLSQYVLFYHSIPYDGDYRYFYARGRWLISDARLVLFTGPPFQVGRRVFSRLVPLIMGLRTFQKYGIWKQRIGHAIEERARSISQYSLTMRLSLASAAVGDTAPTPVVGDIALTPTTHPMRVDETSLKEGAAAQQPQTPKQQKHQQHSASSTCKKVLKLAAPLKDLLAKNPIKDSSIVSTMGFKKVPLPLPLAFTALTVAAVVFMWVRIAATICRPVGPGDPGQWMAQCVQVSVLHD